MKLSTWLQENNVTPSAFAAQVGGVSYEAVRLWVAGRRMPKPRQVLRIEEVTGGAVTVQDLHETRVAALKAEG